MSEFIKVNLKLLSAFKTLAKFLAEYNQSHRNVALVRKALNNFKCFFGEYDSAIKKGSSFYFVISTYIFTIITLRLENCSPIIATVENLTNLAQNLFYGMKSRNSTPIWQLFPVNLISVYSSECIQYSLISSMFSFFLYFFSSFLFNSHFIPTNYIFISYLIWTSEFLVWNNVVYNCDWPSSCRNTVFKCTWY